ncbi:MAG: hypothetical protein ABW352_24045 [Polyangiales bacterium]
MNEATEWTARLLALSWLLQALELWRSRRELEALFPWSLVRRDYGLQLGDAAWPWLIALQALLAPTLLSTQPVFPWLALGVALLQAARFRGSYNGGSDAMTLVVLLGLALARTFSPRLGLAYIAAQLVLSYFLAGLFKLRDPAWRDGSALPRLLAAPQYRSAALHVPFARVAGYAVIVFECAFPLALLDAQAAWAFTVAGITFHVLNARVLGLNRFLWAWLAAYPALLAWSVKT